MFTPLDIALIAGMSYELYRCSEVEKIYQSCVETGPITYPDGIRELKNIRYCGPLSSFAKKLSIKRLSDPLHGTDFRF